VRSFEEFLPRTTRTNTNEEINQEFHLAEARRMQIGKRPLMEELIYEVKLRLFAA